MKILKIEFENINSLKGKWEIDFTHPSFADNHNIFLIHGATGSGKTSILDAITLGLYGKTPRQKNIGSGKDGNEVMTYETFSCYSSVTYECKKGVFTSKWSNTKSTKTNKLQPATFEIKDKDGIIIASDKTVVTDRGKSSTAEKLCYFTAKTTGLEYDQFCRSILLAQGEFSKFLEADPEERSIILQKISGTGEYGKIGKKIVEHFNSLENQKKDLLNKIDEKKEDTLTEDEIKAINLENKELEKQIKKYIEESDQVVRDIAWYDSLAEKKNDMEEDEKKLNEASIQKEQFKNSEELINLAEKAKVCNAAFTDKENAAGNLNKIIKDEERIQKELEETGLNYEKALNNKKSLETELSEMTQFSQEFQNTLKTVRDLDSKIESCQKNYSEAEKNKNEIQEACENINKQIVSLESEIEEKNKEQLNAKKYLEENEVNKSISSKFSLIEQNVKTFYEKKEQYSRQEEVYKNIEEKINDLSSQIQKQTDEMEEDVKFISSNAACENLPVILSKVNGVADKYNSLEKENISLNDKCTELDEELSSHNVKLNELTTELNEVEQKVSSVFEREGAFIASQLQRLLKKGCECPVCGSKEHPLCDNDNNFEPVEDNKEKLEQVTVNIQELTGRKQTLISETASLKVKIEGINKSLEQNRAEIIKNTQEMSGLFLLINECFKQFDVKLTAETFESEIQKYSLLSNEWKLRFERNKEAENTLSSLKSEYTALNVQRTSEEKILNDLKKEVENLKKEIKDTFNSYEIDFDENYISEQLEKLNDLSLKYKENEDKLLSVSNSLTVLQETKRNLKEQLCNEQKSSLKAQEKFNLLNCEYTGLKESRQSLFENKNADEEEKLFNDNFNALKKNVKAATEIFTEIDKKIAAGKDMLSNLKINKTEAEDILSSKNTAFLAELNKYGFENEAAFINARMEEEEISKLKALGSGIEKEFMTCSANYKKSLNAYNKMLSEKRADICDKTVLDEKKEELNKKQQEASDKKAENNQKLLMNSSTGNELKELQDQYDELNKDFAKWSIVKKWIGNIDAKNFIIFVQGITLRRIIKYANDYLKQMTKRYLIESKDGVDFCLRDTNFTEIRSVKNISGGEKFLISLSLALGIAQYSSNNIRVDSLFLDEGFGTLDPETLPVVLDTLKKLPRDGKMLGIISHLPDVYANIDQIIEIKPAAGGSSKIEGEGTRAL